MSLGSVLKDVFLTNRSFASTIRLRPKNKSLPARIYQADYEAVFTGAIKASDDLGWHLVCANRTRGDIAAQRPWGLTTWGDRISISLQPIDEHKVRVDACSYAAGEFFDWGRHARNIRHYMMDLDTQLRSD